MYDIKARRRPQIFSESRWQRYGNFCHYDRRGWRLYISSTVWRSHGYRAPACDVQVAWHECEREFWIHWSFSSLRPFRMERACWLFGLHIIIQVKWPIQSVPHQPVRIGKGCQILDRIQEGFCGCVTTVLGFKVIGLKGLQRTAKTCLNLWRGQCRSEH